MAGRAHNGAGTWKRNKKGEWGLRVRNVRDPATGVVVCADITHWGRTQKEARDERARWERENLVDGRASAIMGKSPKRVRKTVGWVIREYLENHPKGLAPKTARRYRASLETIEREFGTLLAEDLQVGRVRKFQNEGGPGRRTDVALLRAALNWAASADGQRIGRNPLNRVRISKPEPLREKEPIPVEHLARILNASQGRPSQLMWRLLMQTGLRRQELLDLVWDDLDERAGVLHVRKGKGWKSRDLPLTEPGLWHDLREERARQRASGSDYVFPSPKFKGKPLGYPTIGEWWRRDLQDAGFETGTYGIHNLRHTFATMTLNTVIGPNGEKPSVYDVASLLGHASPTTTTRFYAHPTPGGRVAAMNNLGITLAGIQKTVPETVPEAAEKLGKPRDSAD